MPTSPCLILVPQDRTGHERLCRGVAARLGVEADIIEVPTRSVLQRLLALRAPPPLPRTDVLAAERRLVLASGRRAVKLASAIAALPGPRPFVAALGPSGLPARRFDFVWANAHDRVPLAPNLVTTLTAPHQLTRDQLAAAGLGFAATHADLPRPWIAVLVGGPNRAFRFGDTEVEEIAAALTTLANSHGASLLVTTSRRTGKGNRRRLERRLTGAPHFFWDGGGDNPLVGMLGAADTFVVTCDSVNMISEAAFTGKPVYLWPLPGGSAKFDRFHEALRQHGATRWFDGGLDRWFYPPLDATHEVVHAIAQRLKEGAADRTDPPVAGHDPHSSTTRDDVGERTAG